MQFKPTKKTNVKLFYIKKFPTDEVGQEINDKIIFNDVYDCIYNYKNIYDLIGVTDSIIRERVFEGLCEAMETNYDSVYEQWINKY